MYSADADVSSKWDGLVLNFESFNFNPDSEYVTHCSISSTEGKVKTRMKLEGVPEMESLEAIATEVHETMIRRLMLHYGCTFSETSAFVSNRKAISDDGNVIRCMVGRATCTGGRATVSMGINDTGPLRQIFELPVTEKDRWAAILHHVEEVGNPVVGFIGCYHILASHHHDNQKKIDEYIKTNEPNVRMEVRYRSGRNGSQPIQVTETIYTRLRNELMHVLEFTTRRDPREVYAEVRKYRGGLYVLAKNLIAELD
jgi:hypothetical protein